MEIREYRTIDKQAWPAGPWQNEPDKKQWPDPATGLPCIAKRNPFAGFWCGYVGVPPGHPLHGKSCNDVEADCHGGLTFSDACAPDGDEATDICHVPGEGEPEHVHWFGFDCGHAWDLSPGRESFNIAGCVYRDQGFVEAQCAQLAKQLSEGR